MLLLQSTSLLVSGATVIETVVHVVIKFLFIYSILHHLNYPFIFDILIQNNI